MTTPILTIQDAETRFFQLVEEAAAGQESIISKDGKPVARLIPLDLAGAKKLGLLEGQIEVGDAFNAEATDDVLSQFES